MNFSFFGVAALFALVLCNAFFVMSEFALVKFRPTRLQALVDQGNKRAALALKISQQLDAYLSANQLGITLASIALGWVGEPAVAHLLEPLLRGFGAFAVPAAHSVAVGISFVLITVLHVVVGELAPKSIAIQRTETIALWTARPLHVFYLVAFPFIWLLNALSRLVLRLIGMRVVSEGEEAHSPEELRLILRRVHLEPGARRLMDRLVDYTHRVVRHVMTLRADLIMLPAERAFNENVRLAVEHQYSRYLLWSEAERRVVGFVHMKDVTTALVAGSQPASMMSLARQPLFVRDDLPLEALRREFLQEGVLIAVVVDGKGEVLGAVTLEDLLEEFVGEIRDEHDGGEVPPIIRGPGAHFELDGRVTLDVVSRELDFRPTDVPGDIETIGGYARRRLQQAPKVNDVIVSDDVRLVVLEVRHRRIARLRGERRGPAPSGDRSSVLSEKV